MSIEDRLINGFEKPVFPKTILMQAPGGRERVMAEVTTENFKLKSNRFGFRDLKKRSR